MKFRILFGAAIMVASLAVATGLVGTTSIASAALQHGVHVHRW